MDGENVTDFGGLLRRQRLAASLTQEALAERAGLGRRSIQHLERGEVRPQRVTARRLALALTLSGEQRTQFEALAQPNPRRRSAIGEGRASLTPAAVLEDTPMHNLPTQLTSFIGREQEVAEVSRLMGDARLLTLSGTGGVGKTRLALQVAGGLPAHYPAGIWLADLAPLAGPAGVAQAVAAAVGVREEAGQPLLATLVAALRPRRLLLVLDNCEHLLDACAGLVEALLRGCPGVRVLATSREALGIAGETVWRVPSLALPDDQGMLSPEEVGQVAAVRLFVERATVVRPHFALTARNATTVARICRRLDGIPLALELAAALLGGLSLERLAGRMNQRFQLLTRGSRTAPARQQTLLATVEWSYSLLSASEQILFTRLTVFAGDFSLEAVEAVCAGEPLTATEVLGLLLRLVDRSLVTVEERHGEVERYRLLETLRQYGHERLPVDEIEALRARHLTYYRDLAEESTALFGMDSVPWVDRMDAEYTNIREALHCALEARAAWEGLRLAEAICDYWFCLGYLAEAGRWFKELLALPEAAARISARASALRGLGYFQRSAGLMVGSPRVSATTIALLVEAVAIARETGDKPILCNALWQLGGMIIREDYAAGCALLEEHLTLLDSSSPWGVIPAWNTLGDAAWEQGDAVAAHTWWSDALRLARQEEDQLCIALQLGDLGMMAFHQGDYAAARGWIEESLALYRTLHMHQLVALSLGCLGAVARAQSDLGLARRCGEEKLAFWRNVGDRTGIAASLAELGSVALQEGNPVQAQVLFDQSLTLRREVGDWPRVAASLAHLGDLAYVRGDHVQAATRYAEGLELLCATPDRGAAAACLEGLALVAVADGQPEHAARLYGAAAAQRRGTFVLHVWDDPVARDRQVAARRAALGDEAFAAAWAEGQAMTPTEAITPM